MNKIWKILISILVFIALTTLCLVVYITEISWWWFFGPLGFVIFVGLIFIIIYIITKQKTVEVKEEEIKKKVNVSPEVCRQISDQLLKSPEYLDYASKEIELTTEQLGSPGKISRICCRIVKSYYDNIDNYKAIIFDMSKPYKKYTILSSDKFDDEFRKRIKDAKELMPDRPLVEDIIKRESKIGIYGVPEFKEEIRKKKEEEKKEEERVLGPFAKEEKKEEENKEEVK